MSDYRNTKYCSCLDSIKTDKMIFGNKIHKEHPRVKDLHAQISPNACKYKTEFIKMYNGKCAYCGVSIQLIPRRMFEIDHYIPVTSRRFRSRACAGFMDNLILSCHTCNHNKGDFEVPDYLLDQLHPDNPGIKKSFFRDDLFYIRVVPEQPVEVTEFYNKLNLGRETNRIDYLLMCMLGLYSRIEDRPDIHDKLGKAIELLRAKRNHMA